ncbi:MAG: D-alanyl-D-alanine carboxypeptidase family protein [Clostridiaceae bacterium]
MKFLRSTLVVTIIAALMFPMTAFADDLPTIKGTESLVVDIKTGEIIYGVNIDQKVYPASTTKLITSLLLAEHNKKTDILKYTESAKVQPQYSINTNLKTMKIGETMTADDVMKALMIYSANDIAYMVADNVAGNSSKFIDMMNKKAADLGLKNTHFTSPNGLHDDNHYTTTYELSVIGIAAYKNPWVKEIMGTSKVNINTSDNKPILDIPNRNKLLGKYGCTGGKTGWTTQAGRCLVAFFNRDGRELVGVVMNSEYGEDTAVFDDMKKIIDYSYSLKKTTLYSDGQTIKTLDIKYKPLGFGFTKTMSIPVIVKGDVKYYANDINNKEMKPEIKLSDINVWKLSKDSKIGTLTLSQRGANPIFYLVTSVSTGSIVKDNILLYGGILLLILLLLVFIFVVLHNLHRGSKRRRYY